MGKTRPLDPQAWNDILAQTRALVIGATEAYPGFFPDGLGITQRTKPRNELLGTVMTKPEPFIVMLGVSWLDTDEPGDNEDMLKVDENTLEITPMRPKDFEREYPQYAPYHHEAKDYLRKPPSSE